MKTLTNHLRTLLVVSLVAGAIIAALGLPRPAHAATFIIADGDITGPDGLISAINKANDESAYPGLDTIELAANGDYLFTNEYPAIGSGRALPIISSNIRVNGNGATLKMDAQA